MSGKKRIFSSRENKREKSKEGGGRINPERGEFKEGYGRGMKAEEASYNVHPENWGMQPEGGVMQAEGRGYGGQWYNNYNRYDGMQQYPPTQGQYYYYGNQYPGGYMPNNQYPQYYWGRGGHQY